VFWQKKRFLVQFIFAVARKNYFSRYFNLSSKYIFRPVQPISCACFAGGFCCLALWRMQMHKAFAIMDLVFQVQKVNFWILGCFGAVNPTIASKKSTLNAFFSKWQFQSPSQNIWRSKRGMPLKICWMILPNFDYNIFFAKSCACVHGPKSF